MTHHFSIFGPFGAIKPAASGARQAAVRRSGRSQRRREASISRPMASDSATVVGQTQPVRARAPARRAHFGAARPAEPIARGMGLDQPFFDDKNRAFWILQTIGWSGYFFLRSLSGFANSMGWMWLVHTLLLTASGYSLTLLLASLFRRLIRMQAGVDPDPVAGRGDARLERLLGDRDVELRDLPQARFQARRGSNIWARSCSISRCSRRGRRSITGSIISCCSRTRSTSASGSRARRRARSWRCCATSSTRISCSTR